MGRNPSGSLLIRLFAKRHVRFKWIVVLPAILALVSLGHAFQDDGLYSAMPHIGIALSTLYLVRPMLVAWPPILAAFVFYGLAVLVNPNNGPRGEWIIFLLIGIIPAVCLWLARPREFVRPRSSSARKAMRGGSTSARAARRSLPTARRCSTCQSTLRMAGSPLPGSPDAFPRCSECSHPVSSR
jgi:hypothetical protein